MSVVDAEVRERHGIGIEKEVFTLTGDEKAFKQWQCWDRNCRAPGGSRKNCDGDSLDTIDSRGPKGGGR